MSIVIVPLEVIAKGHVLVIPKLQVDQFFDLPDEEYQALMITVKKVAAQMKEIYKTARVGMQVVGLDVPHVHVHVVAFDTLEEFYGVAGGGTVDEPKLVELTQKLGV
jgi:histidine triad (HIT) family protein